MNSDQFETGIPAPQGLYDFEQERDACGVGLVADLKNEPSHKIIEMGITVLKRLMHRGAVGSDPDTWPASISNLPWPSSTSATARILSQPGAWPIPSGIWPTTGKSTLCAGT